MEELEMFKVYSYEGDVLATFDTVNEAMVYAKKGLRAGGRSRRIKSTVYNKVLYSVRKDGDGKYVILDLR